MNVKEMKIDSMSISSHKLYGPKGCGALYIKNGIKIDNLIDGGHQERKKRGGTLNTPGIVGFGKAVEIAVRDLSLLNEKMRKIRGYFIRKIKKDIPHVIVNEHPRQRAESIVNITFELIEGEAILLMLDFEGIGNNRSAYIRNIRTIYVLKAMGIENGHEWVYKISFTVLQQK